jgi:hypothetical protein
MNTKSNLHRTTLLTLCLAFAATGAATAGAVFKHGDDRDKPNERSSTSRKPDSKDSDKSASSRQPDSRSSERYATGKQAGSRDSDRYRPDRSSAPARPSASSERTMRDKGAPDATPTYRDNSADWDRSRNRDASVYDYIGRPRDTDDSKYRRGTDREYRYRPPQYRGGHYYYDNSPYIHVGFPCDYGYWAFDYVPGATVRSAYYYYDYLPYVPYGRVTIVSRPRVTVVEVPIIIREKSYDGGYYLDRPVSDSLDVALSDIRRSWVTDDPNLLLRHVRSDVRVDVLLDGGYSYSLNGDDYRNMTRDAVLSTETVDFRFDTVRSRGDDRVIAYGTHRFQARYGDTKTVYVSYLLERRYSEWIITEVGSSPRSLGC